MVHYSVFHKQQCSLPPTSIFLKYGSWCQVFFGTWYPPFHPPIVDNLWVILVLQSCPWLFPVNVFHPALIALLRGLHLVLMLFIFIFLVVLYLVFTVTMKFWLSFWDIFQTLSLRPSLYITYIMTSTHALSSTFVGSMYAIHSERIL